MSRPLAVHSIIDHYVPYEQGVNLQRSVVEARKAGEIGDTLIFLEHEPVITIGKRSDPGDLVTSRTELSSRGISVTETDRGGEITYHGPGQLIGYPIISLDERKERDLHRFLRRLEEVLIVTLEEFGLQGSRKEGLTGVWVGEEKIAAMGIRVSRWITMHGFSLNVDPDLSVMCRDIIPCGIKDKGVTSLSELGIKADRPTVEAAVLRSFCFVFDYDPRTADNPLFLVS